MDELIKLVSEKSGISEAQSKTAVETTVNFLKDKLPAPLAGQVDSALGNEAGMAAGADAISKGLGGLFGKK